jgi:effector-binding domain-containing protein
MEQLKSLPLAADEVIGEQQAGGKRLIGYRVRKAPLSPVFPGLQALDLWVDAGTRAVDHVDIVIQEAGKPPHQMHITDIRVDAEINRSLFDLTPPAGYTAIQPAPSLSAQPLRSEIGQAAAQTAVVMPMRGPYTQTRSALQTVESYLKSLGVTPVGPAFGRYESEQHWDAGYPVPPGTRVEPPFQLVALPEALVATAVVNGPWGKAAENQWGAFVISVVKQGYAIAGPLVETWSGEDAQPSTQSTELRIPVTKAN